VVIIRIDSFGFLLTAEKRRAQGSYYSLLTLLHLQLFKKMKLQLSPQRTKST